MEPVTLEAVLERLERLEDVEAIKTLVSRYAQACDAGYADTPGARARAANAVAALFTEDGRWESNVFGSYRGRGEIHGLIAGIGETVDWALHYLLAPTVELGPRPDHATGSWYLFELASLRRGDGGLDAVVLSGVYRCTFRKRAGEWLIEQMAAEFHQVSNLDEGWVRQRFRAL